MAVSRLAASTARSAGTAAGRTWTAAAGNDVARLMGIQDEHVAVAEILRPVLDPADARRIRFLTGAGNSPD